ncbi:hypothetical protein ACFQZ2_14345 [Streptomonospora algeriensis]|uniref:Uncharacterized protein n=1 Tax=Streptomonospora algeriensis TaxID=995084 RepID=A0ABW3BHF9_9ACTN
MSEPDRIAPSPAATSTTAQEQRPAGARLVQALLWTLFAACLAGNAVGSPAGMPMLLNAAFGVGALGCLAAAIVHHRRTRHQSGGSLEKGR